MRNTVDLIENELINFLFVGLVWIHSDERRSLSSFVAKRELAVDQVNPSYSYDGFAAISHSENRPRHAGKSRTTQSLSKNHCVLPHSAQNDAYFVRALTSPP